MAEEDSSTRMCLLIDAVETRHRWLSRYAAAGERGTHESVAGVSRTLCFGRKPRGLFSPGSFFLFLRKYPLPLCSPRRQRFPKKKTFTPGGVDKGHYGIPGPFSLNNCYRCIYSNQVKKAPHEPSYLVFAAHGYRYRWIWLSWLGFNRFWFDI